MADGVLFVVVCASIRPSFKQSEQTYISTYKLKTYIIGLDAKAQGLLTCAHKNNSKIEMISTLVLNQNHFIFHLYNNMVNVFVYGITMAANVFANHQTRSANIFRS